MNDAAPTPLNEDTLGWALCFEVSLGVIALLLGYGFGIRPAELLRWPISVAELALGICCAFPPLLVMLRLQKSRIPAILRLNEQVDTQVWPIFHGLSLPQLALISAAAGWGEELLFRGFVQADLTARLGAAPAILIASVLFGLMHLISPTYFVLATITSIYLGWIFWQFDSMWIPIITHAVYDFLMLVVLQSRQLQKEAQEEG